MKFEIALSHQSNTRNPTPSPRVLPLSYRKWIKTNKQVQKIFLNKLKLIPEFCFHLKIHELSFFFTENNLYGSKVYCLTHSFPMHTFFTPWKHQKTVRFLIISHSNFQSVYILHCFDCSETRFIVIIL